MSERAGTPAPHSPAPYPPDETLDEPAGIAEALEERLDLRGRSLREATARGAMINSAFQVGFAGIGLLKRVAVAAFLTASEFGIWGLIVTTLITLTWLKQIGVGDKYVQQSEADQEAAFQKAFSIELVYTLCFYVVVLVALPVYALIYGRTEILLPGFVLSLSLLASALHTPIWIAYRRMRFVRQRTLEGIDPVVSAVVMIALAAAGMGYWSLVIGSVAGSFCAAIAAVTTSPYRLRFRLERGTVREYFDFSWPLFLSGASGLVVVQGAVLVGNWTVGLAGVGAIGLAGSFAMFADRVDQIIRTTIYPAVCAVRERTELLFEAFVKSNRVALMWGLPFGVGMALFAPDLVRFVLGESWREAEFLLQAFGLIIGIRQVAFSWTVFMAARGDTRPMAVNGAFILLTFFVVTLPAMLVLGLDGYVIGVSASLVVELAVRGHYLRRLFPGFRLTSHLARALAPSVPAAAAVIAVRLAADLERTPLLAAAELVLYIAVTAAATVVFERPLIAELARYVRSRGSGAPAPA